VSVKNLGAGSLFSKVELEDDDQSEQPKQTSQSGAALQPEDKVIVRELSDEGYIAFLLDHSYIGVLVTNCYYY